MKNTVNTNAPIGEFDSTAAAEIIKTQTQGVKSTAFSHQANTSPELIESIRNVLLSAGSQK